MQANEMTFGVEFEVTLPAGTISDIGGYHHGRQIPGLPAGWNAQHDGSIHATRGRQAVEIVSPILKGDDGIAQIAAVCEWFKRIGASVNQSTGFHVHVGWNGNADALARLVHLVSHHEKALYATTGTKKRERGAYCRGVRNDGQFIGRFVQGRQGFVDRYRVLNVTNLDHGNKPTVEFRVFAGTTNFIKAVANVELCLALVEKAHKMARKTNWTPKQNVATSPIARKGAGQTELVCLLYAIGWTKGRESHTFGEIGSPLAPSIKQLKQELMRLARKYDKSND